jgi:hypothetical protein
MDAITALALLVGGFVVGYLIGRPNYDQKMRQKEREIVYRRYYGPDWDKE